MQNDLEISTAYSCDVDDILALYRHLIPDDPDLHTARAKEIFQQFEAFGDSAIFLGRISGELVTSCTLLVIPNLTRNGRPYGLIENVVTSQDYRGQGHGQALMQYVINYACAHNCYKIMLMTGSQKLQTHAFYEKCGFSASKVGFQIRQLPARKE